MTGTPVSPSLTPAVHGDRVSLLRVLGPVHVWALGVGIVLVGEFTGWNFSADKGGALVYHGNVAAGLEAACAAMIDRTGIPATNDAVLGDAIDARQMLDRQCLLGQG